jgi:hypothetical protein
MYRNHSGQYTQNIDKTKVEEKPAIGDTFRLKNNRPTGRRKVINAIPQPDGSWKQI